MKKLIFILVLFSCKKEIVTPEPNCGCGVIYDLEKQYNSIYIKNNCTGNIEWMSVTKDEMLNYTKYGLTKYSDYCRPDKQKW